MFELIKNNSLNLEIQKIANNHNGLFSEFQWKGEKQMIGQENVKRKKEQKKENQKSVDASPYPKVKIFFKLNKLETKFSLASSHLAQPNNDNIGRERS